MITALWAARRSEPAPPRIGLAAALERERCHLVRQLGAHGRHVREIRETRREQPLGCPEDEGGGEGGWFTEHLAGLASRRQLARPSVSDVRAKRRSGGSMLCFVTAQHVESEVCPPDPPRLERCHPSSSGHSRSARAPASAAILVLLLSMGAMGGEVMAKDEGDVALPAPSFEGEVPVERALALRRSVREFAPGSLPLSAVSQVLWAAQGITDPSGLRTAPSAGALYPLEVYLVAGSVVGVRPGVYHYHPRHHRLVFVSGGDRRAGVARAALRQQWVAEAPAIIVLAAVYQRTARKYGELSERYVHMEAGHAAQNVYLQAGALGLGTTMVGAFHDEKLARVLDLPDPTKPLGLLPVGNPR